VSDWDSRFMTLASHISAWSKDPSTKVGAVVVDHMRRVIATGYNGFARGVRDTEERYLDKPTKYRLVVHAELNAILNAVIQPRGASLYVTMAPCSDCAKAIVQSGLYEVMCPQWRSDGHWAEDGLSAKLILEEAGVRLIHA
jgi:dCMP deaminase